MRDRGARAALEARSRSRYRARMAGTRAASTINSEHPLAAHVALGVVQVCFGLFPVFGKLAFRSFAPLSVGCWRIAFGSAALLALAATLHGARVIPPRADFGRIVLCSFLGIAANMALYLEGLKRSTAVNAGLVMCLIPVFTFVVALAAGQERFRLQRALGIVLALFGTSLLFWAERPDLVSEYGFGNLLMALNSACYATYLVLARPLTRKHPPVCVIAWVFVAALPWMPLLAWRDLATRAAPTSVGEFIWPSDASSATIASLAFILLLPTFVAYLLNAFALSRVRASTTAVYIYAQLLIIAVTSRLVLHEELTATMIGAALCIFPGMYLVSRVENKHRGAPASS